MCCCSYVTICYLSLLTPTHSPPQPSAVPVGSQHPVSSHPLPSSSAGVLSAPPTSPPPPPLVQHNNNGFGTNGGGAKERPITAEAAASNLIISRQALTGKQIASITGSATTAATLGQSGLPESTYTSPHSNSGMEMSSAANPPGFNRSSSSDAVSSREQVTGMMDWSSANAQNRPSASTSSYGVPLGQGVVAVPPSSGDEFHDGGGEDGAPFTQQQGPVLQSNGSTVDPTSLPVATSSISASFSAAGHIAGGGGVMGSPSKNVTASPGGTGVSSSPRPHILRGVKRPHERCVLLCTEVCILMNDLRSI